MVRLFLANRKAAFAGFTIALRLSAFSFTAEIRKEDAKNRKATPSFEIQVRRRFSGYI